MQAGSLFVKIELHDRNVPLGPFDNLEMQPVTIVECGSFGLGSPEQTGEKLDPRYTAKPGAVGVGTIEFVVSRSPHQ